MRGRRVGGGGRVVVFLDMYICDGVGKFAFNVFFIRMP
jgi:hypothetical protein